MKVFRIAAVFALLAGPAYAQTPHINLVPEMKSQTPEEKEREDAQQKAYRDSLSKIPDAKAPSDPWGTVRSTEAPKTTAKPKTRPAARKPRRIPADRRKISRSPSGGQASDADWSSNVS